MQKALKICSWNILAPELLFYFWRSSYGLNYKTKKGIILENQYYNDITNIRLENIINYFRKNKFDVILLQEITNNLYIIKDDKLVNDKAGLTIHQIIANALKYKVVSESFKTGKFNSGFPPQEQHKDIVKNSIYSGVATLTRPELFDSFENVVTAEKCKNKSASPFTLDRLILNNDKNGKSEKSEKSDKNNLNEIFIGNVHIKMDFPHIYNSLFEIYNCIIDSIDLGILRLVLMGDFNAHALKAATELYTSSFNTKMFDIFASQLVDDHIFVGNHIRLYESDAYIDASVPILEMGMNLPSTGRKWTVEETRYKHSKHNQDLLDKKTVTTDHPPIVVEFNLTKKRAKNQSILV